MLCRARFRENWATSRTRTECRIQVLGQRATCILSLENRGSVLGMRLPLPDDITSLSPTSDIARPVRVFRLLRTLLLSYTSIHPPALQFKLFFSAAALLQVVVNHHSVAVRGLVGSANKVLCADELRLQVHRSPFQGPSERSLVLMLSMYYVLCTHVGRCTPKTGDRAEKVTKSFVAALSKNHIASPKRPFNMACLRSYLSHRPTQPTFTYRQLLTISYDSQTYHTSFEGNRSSKIAVRTGLACALPTQVCLFFPNCGPRGGTCSVLVQQSSLFWVRSRSFVATSTPIQTDRGLRKAHRWWIALRCQYGEIDRSNSVQLQNVLPHSTENRNSQFGALIQQAQPWLLLAPKIIPRP